uniref:NADH-ubiquinone oxidoreductase chain 6 n=1 Tax=Blattella bisignata TaxID=415194 RepID=J7FJH7_9NEOP|nr:NADH dehydrogenase subunit 6 [Blattella bisignata]AFO85481.1 NADH dehydrogenase subunit 6 [Blattella bisignata]
MLTTLVTMSTILSIVFTQMNHPLAMGLVLLSQTVMISLISGMLSQSFWFSYILFLIFLGGMLILFIYVTSLASNEMFFLSTKVIIFSMTMMFMLIILFSMNKLSTTQNQEMINFLMLKNPLINSLTKLYNQPTGAITILLASYLFLTLIAVVKITNIFMGPLRQMN